MSLFNDHRCLQTVCIFSERYYTLFEVLRSSKGAAPILEVSMPAEKNSLAPITSWLTRPSMLPLCMCLCVIQSLMAAAPSSAKMLPNNRQLALRITTA